MLASTGVLSTVEPVVLPVPCVGTGITIPSSFPCIVAGPIVLSLSSSRVTGFSATGSGATTIVVFLIVDAEGGLGDVVAFGACTLGSKTSGTDLNVGS